MLKRFRILVCDCLRKVEEILVPENPSSTVIEEFRAYLNLIPTNEKQSIDITDTIDEFYYLYPRTFDKIVEEF